MTRTYANRTSESDAGSGCRRSSETSTCHTHAEVTGVYIRPRVNSRRAREIALSLTPISPSFFFFFFFTATLNLVVAVPLGAHFHFAIGLASYAIHRNSGATLTYNNTQSTRAQSPAISILSGSHLPHFNYRRAERMYEFDCDSFVHTRKEEIYIYLISFQWKKSTIVASRESSYLRYRSDGVWKLKIVIISISHGKTIDSIVEVPFVRCDFPSTNRIFIRFVRTYNVSRTAIPRKTTTAASRISDLSTPRVNDRYREEPLYTFAKRALYLIVPVREK